MTAARFVADEMRGRYLNPQWIEAMKAEGYAGTLEVLEVTNNLFGWHATAPGVVRDDQWQALHETYVADTRGLGTREWFDAANPTAQAQIIERMAEAVRKGLWQADAATRRELAERWRQLVAAGADAGDPVTTAFIERGLEERRKPVSATARAPDYGLGPSLLADIARGTTAAPAIQALPAAGPPAPTVRGNVMQQILPPPQAPVPALARLSAWLLLLVFLLGAWLQWRNRSFPGTLEPA